MDQRLFYVMRSQQCSVQYSCPCESDTSSKWGQREFGMEKVWLETWHPYFLISDLRKVTQPTLQLLHP